MKRPQDPSGKDPRRWKALTSFVEFLGDAQDIERRITRARTSTPW